jgi:hypothetical protein
MTAETTQEPVPGTPASERQRSFFGRNAASTDGEPIRAEAPEGDLGRPTKWSMGILNDPDTHEVPGRFIRTL